jgi:hypothetical protein
MKKNLLSLVFVFNLAFTFGQLSGSGKACDFAASYINVPHSASLSPASAITLEAWVKADSYGANSWDNVIISKDGWGTGNQGYTLRTGAGGVLSFNFSSAGVWKEVLSTATMTIGNWYHVAGTYDGLNMRIYINGVEQNSLAFSGSITNGTYDLTIGKMSYLTGGTRYFDGQIDEVKIWSSALTQTQIRDYMCQKVTNSHPQYANLRGYWNMDQTGSILDQTANGNNGTLVGAAIVNSGAPIGNASVYSYLSTANLSLNSGSTDTAKVSSTTPLPLAHLYRVDGLPVVQTTSAVINSFDQTHYYGVYVTPTPASNYTFEYHYGINPLVAGGNEIYAGLGVRTTGSTSPWSAATTSQNQALNTLTYSASGRKEMILSLNCTPVNITPANNQNLCDGDSVLLQVNNAVSNIQWYNGTIAIPGATSPTFYVSSSGIYNLTGNTGICAATSANVTVTVHAIPTVDFGDLPSGSFCITDGLQTITNSIPASGGTYSGAGIFGPTFTPNMASAGTHTLYYNFTDAFGCHDVDSFLVNLGTPPPAPVISVSGLVLCVPSCDSLIWSLTGNVLTGASDSCYTASANGTYSVYCITPEGCISATADYEVSGLGINESTWANAIQIVPNPTQNVLTISIQNSSIDDLMYSLADINGRKIESNAISGVAMKIDLSNYVNGVYFITLYNSEGQTVKRIVKN